MNRISKAVLWGLAALAVFVALAVAAIVILVQTPWFEDQVRTRIAYEVEKATGGKTEIGGFGFSLRHGAVTVNNLVVHGNEPAGQAPLLRIQSAQLGLRIVSVRKRQVNLESLVVVRPEFHVIIYPDGRTNIPGPKTPRRPGPTPIERVVDLSIGRLRLEHGVVTLHDEKIPLSLDAQDLVARLDFNRAARAYSGQVAFGRVYVTPPNLPPLPLTVNTAVVLEGNRVEFSQGRIGMGDSTADFNGSLADFRAPRLDLNYTAHFDLKTLAARLNLRGFTRGEVALTGVLAGSAPTWGGLFAGLTSRAQMRASGVAYHAGSLRLDRMDAASALVANAAARTVELPDLRLTGRVVRIATGPPFAKLRDFPVAMTANVEIGRPGIEARRLVAHALGGEVYGSVDLADFHDLRVNVNAEGFSLHQIVTLAGVRNAVWDGTISGPVRVTGVIRDGSLRDAIADAKLTIRPVPGPNPVHGLIDLAYSERTDTLELGRSRLAMRSSQAQFSGVFGRRLDVSLESSDLSDFEPALALGTSGAPPKLPVALDHGTARFQGTITGPLHDPQIAGNLALARFLYEGRPIDSLQADVAVSRTGVKAENLAVRKGRIALAGTVQAGFRDWRITPREPVSGQFTLEAPEVQQLIAETGEKLPVSGNLSGTFTLAGAFGAPLVSGKFTVAKGALDGQTFERAQADLRYSNGLIEVSPAVVEVGGSQVVITAAFQHPPSDWTSGSLRFDVSGKGVPLAALEPVARRSPGLAGCVDTQLAGALSFAKSTFKVSSLDGRVALSGLSVDKAPVGDLLLTAATKGQSVGVQLTGTLAGARFSGSSQWTLADNYPVRGEIEFTRVDFSRLLLTAGQAGLPFQGFAAGDVSFSGSTLDPKSWRAHLDLNTLEITPQLTSLGLTPRAPATLTNDGPVVLEITSGAARIQRAQLTGRDTNVRLTGAFSFTSRNPWDARVQGTVNLSALENFEPKVTSSGELSVDVTLRGPLRRPEVFGRAEIRNGSVYYGTLPNGLDRISAVVLLFRDRATIERFSAESGGGKVALTGFVGFGAPFTYYLQLKGDQIRYRSREGISVAANTTLNFTGTSERSVLAGDVMVTRVAFTPHTDLGTLLGQATQPVPTLAAPSPFAQGIRLDVNIRTAAGARFETALARGLQAEADLRLRGDPTRPLLLGRILITQGEILFFGTKYTIDSGEIVFVNPTRILPLVNLALQTKVRGIDVTLTLNGPINKLNVTYRSDPPLQWSDIVSLLATGQTPASAPGLAGAQSLPTQSWEQAGASALLTQALANPLAGRLQRFLGISSLKIAPTLSPVTNTPEARVTIEQQITPDLTFTYITNLARAQEQSVQVQWDLTKTWSALATREENGVFGIDFLYKRTFK